MALRVKKITTGTFVHGRFVATKRNPTIYGSLATKLGRIPTNAELKAEVERIKTDALVEVARKGKLGFQKRKR